MTALVAAETVLVVLLTLLVAALLRSHAEILRRLDPESAEPGDEVAPLPAAAQRAGVRPASDVAGATPSGDAVKIALEGDSQPTLLGFLSTSARGCERFWSDLRAGRPPELPEAVRIVLVVEDLEDVLRLRELSPLRFPVVMSSDAWRAYAVPAAPYFVLVEGGRVQGEGSAAGWRQISSLLRDAIADRAAA